MLDYLTDGELAVALVARGYVVRRASEARQVISWNRTAPFPEGLDFQTEALEKVREQITPELLWFSKTPAEPPAFDGDLGRPEIHRAVLRVL